MSVKSINKAMFQHTVVKGMDVGKRQVSTVLMKMLVS